MQMDRERAGVFAHPFAEVSLCPTLLTMVPLQMLDHLELLLGLVAAVAAEERVFVGVGEVMVPQASCPPKAPVAHVADVRLLLAVFLQVSLQEEAGLESLPALLADERAGLAVAGLLVDAQGVGAVGTVLALVTLVWLDTCVGSREKHVRRGEPSF